MKTRYDNVAGVVAVKPPIAILESGRRRQFPSFPTPTTGQRDGAEGIREMDFPGLLEP